MESLRTAKSGFTNPIHTKFIFYPAANQHYIDKRLIEDIIKDFESVIWEQLITE